VTIILYMQTERTPQALPTIHINGSSPKDLFENACEALGALRKAIQAVEETSPNGRDYYPQGDGAIKTAVCEHASRIERLRSVIAELEELAEHITDTRGSR
jgi:hypothetical protein